MGIPALVQRGRRLVIDKSAPTVLFWRRLLLGVVVFVVLTAIVSVPSFFKISGVIVGKPSPRTIKAPHAVSFVDAARTRRLRALAADRAEKVYDVDFNAVVKVQRNVDAFFGEVTRVSMQRAPASAKVSLLERRLHVKMPRDALAIAVQLDPRSLALLRARTQQLVQVALADKITTDNIESERVSLRAAASKMDLPRDNAKVAGMVGSVYLEPTYVVNVAETSRARRQAAAAVAPVIVRKQRGETIVEEGRVVTASDIEALEREGILGGRVGARQVVGYALAVLAVIAASAMYLRRYRSHIFDDVALLTMLSVIIVSFALFIKVISPFASPYLLPFIGPAILACVLLGGRVALVTTLANTVLAFLIIPESALPVIVLMIGSLIAALLLSKIVERGSLITGAALAVAAVGYLAMTSSLISGDTIRESLLAGGYGLGGGLFGVVLGLGSLPLFESVFHVTTDIRLLELADPGQPLMRELMLKAPGTYNHSMIVGNLAESAAPFVDADPLKARVGAYYHDIGKLKRPLFFIENQMMGQNPHDQTRPNLSCLIVTAHVKDGVELARRYRIPEDIIDVIREHHGTSVVTYFYQQAKEQAIKQQVCEEDFRYGSVRPRSREAALVMLADAIEAAARTMRKPTPSKLEHLTKTIIKERLEDGQLDDSHLTLSDLEEVCKHYAQVLASIYHARIEYPHAKITPISGARKAHGRSDK